MKPAKRLLIFFVAQNIIGKKSSRLVPFYELKPDLNSKLQRETKHMKILLATANKGKVTELEALLADRRLNILSLADFPAFPDVEETGATFAENALIKARSGAEYTGLLTLADDSGLEVDVLGGAPGVYSARYAGEPKDDERNTQRLLAELENIPYEQRTARFRCSLALVFPSGQEYVTEGTVEGIILTEKRGTGGFGYDPVFYLPSRNKTMAELDMGEKNTLSHRFQAFQKAVPIIKDFFSASF